VTEGKGNGFATEWDIYRFIRNLSAYVGTYFLDLP